MQKVGGMLCYATGGFGWVFAKYQTMTFEMRFYYILDIVIGKRGGWICRPTGGRGGRGLFVC